MSPSPTGKAVVRIRLRVAALGVVIAMGAVSTSHAAGSARPEEDVRRLLTLLAAIGEEYREGVEDGKVVRPIEYDEAKTFLDDAQQRARSIPATQSEPRLAAVFATIGVAIDQKVAAETVADKLATLRQQIVEFTGISEQVYPPEPPSAVRGKLLFSQYCVTCHGEHGDGKGPSAAKLNPAPADFTNPQFIRGETPYDFYHVISLGKTQTAMPAWDGVLSVQDRWDVVSYVWTLAPGASGIAEGQGTYLAQCASCHGATGNGQAPFTQVLLKPAPDLSRPQALARRSDQELFGAATNGIGGTPMPAFERTLGEDERWKAVAFMRLLSLGGPGNPTTNSPGGGSVDGKRFGGVLGLLGRTYQHAWSADRLTNATAYNEATALTEQVAVSAETLAERIEASVPDVAAKLREQTAAIVGQVRSKVAPTELSAAVETLVAFVDSQPALSAAPAPAGGFATPAATATDAALAESGKLLDASLAAYERGEPQAVSVAGDAYLQFEPLEQRLGATAPGLKTRIEERFLQVRQRLRAPGNAVEVRTLAGAIHDDFAAVRTALQPHTSPYALFIESATIILREGFEIVLVIGALIAYVVKTGNAAMKRSLHAGTILGIVASLATAFAMDELLRLHPSSSDLLEGVTMLLAAVVLFWVSYWLISKAEADKWQRYIRGKVQTALSTRRTVALAGVAFLAVYREGFETVLFYQALYASAPGASMTVSAGFVAGAVALAIVYVLFRRFQVQIPIQQFFFATGLLLYALAAIFAGQGVHELQEAGFVSMTPVTWMPTIPLLGMYPSLESLLVQAVFVALLLYATAVTWRRTRTAAAVQQDDTLAEVRALRLAVEALHQAIDTLARSEASGLSGAVGERLEGLLTRVDEVAGRIQTKVAVNEH